MSRQLFVVVPVSIAFLLAIPTEGWSIIIQTVKNERVSGFLVEESDTELSIKTRSGYGKETVVTFERNRVKIIHQVDRKKLAELRPEKPAAYRDYAAKLAEHRDDPEAKDLARRLYLLAAFRMDGKLRRQCLLDMCDVARDPAEAGRIRALAYLLESQRDPSILNQKSKKQDLSWDDFRMALRALRLGEVSIAQKYSAKPGVAECFSALPDFVSLKRFDQMCANMQCRCEGDGSIACLVCKGKGRISGGRLCNNCRAVVNGRTIVTGKVTCPGCDGRGVAEELTDHQLRLILKIELHLEKKKIKSVSKRHGTSWSVPLSNQRVSPVRELTLETVTEINPRACVYRDGEWVEP